MILGCLSRGCGTVEVCNTLPQVVCCHVLLVSLHQPVVILGSGYHKSHGRAKPLPVNGVFIVVVHKLNTDFINGQLVMENGCVKTGLEVPTRLTEASVAGVFAAGGVSDHVYRQAVTSAGTGCMAALDAEQYLESLPAREK